jgi:hypothetical protein
MEDLTPWAFRAFEGPHRILSVNTPCASGRPRHFLFRHNFKAAVYLHNDVGGNNNKARYWARGSRLPRRDSHPLEHAALPGRTDPNP